MDAIHVKGVDSLVVADYTLRAYAMARVKNDALLDDMTLLKLIKMVYVAHGYCLAMFDFPLVDEPVEAWEKGPVIPSIYHEAMEFPVRMRSGVLSVSLFDTRTIVLPPPFNKPHMNARRVIEKVCEVFGHMDGPWLSRLTHEEDSPWVGYDAERHEKMDDAKIKAHYLYRMENAGQREMGL